MRVSQSFSIQQLPKPFDLGGRQNQFAKSCYRATRLGNSLIQRWILTCLRILALFTAILSLLAELSGLCGRAAA
jgi:hypothetical protein